MEVLPPYIYLGVKYYSIQGINQPFHHSPVSGSIPGLTRLLLARRVRSDTAACGKSAIAVDNWDAIYKIIFLGQREIAEIFAFAVSYPTLRCLGKRQI